MRPNTYQLARRLGGFEILSETGVDRKRWLISDWSEGTGEVFGWPLINGIRGRYQQLPTLGLVRAEPLVCAPMLGIIPSDKRFRHVRCVAYFSNGVTVYERTRERMAALLEAHERSRARGHTPGKLEWVVDIKKWKV